MKILTSALKHGLTEDDIKQVIAYGEYFELEDESRHGNPCVMHVGYGLAKEELLEVKVEYPPVGDDIVFHAMKVTRHWRAKFFQKRAPQ